MDKIFQKIYREVISNEEELYEFGRKMECEVYEMMAGCRDRMNEEEIEKMTEQIDDLIAAAGQRGFYFGVRFAVRGLVSLLADEKG